VELNQPAEVIFSAGPSRKNPRNLYRQPPARTSSLLTLSNLVPSWRSSSVSLSCPQIPPLDFGEEIVVWQTDQFTPVEPSPPQSDRSSLYSQRTSVISRRSTFTRGSQRSVASRLGRQQTRRSSILNVSHEPGPLSPLQVALTTYQAVHTTSGQPRIIKKATMEGLIQYLLQKSAGE
jgi:hypothetical protein